MSRKFVLTTVKAHQRQGTLDASAWCALSASPRVLLRTRVLRASRHSAAPFTSSTFAPAPLLVTLPARALRRVCTPWWLAEGVASRCAGAQITLIDLRSRSNSSVDSFLHLLGLQSPLSTTAPFD